MSCQSEWVGWIGRTNDVAAGYTKEVVVVCRKAVKMNSQEVEKISKSTGLVNSALFLSGG